MASRSRNTADSLKAVLNAAVAPVDRRYLDQQVITGTPVTVDLEFNSAPATVVSANQLIVFVNNVIQVPGVNITSAELNASLIFNYRLASSNTIEFSTGDLVAGDLVDIIYDNSIALNVPGTGSISPDKISTTGLSPNSRYVIALGNDPNAADFVTYQKSPNWQSLTSSPTLPLSIFAQYFIDTSGGAITATLPASSSNGEEISFLDTGSSLSTNNLTITPQSGGRIQNAVADESLVVATNNSGFTLVHAGSNNWFLKDR